MINFYNVYSILDRIIFNCVQKRNKNVIDEYSNCFHKV